MILRTLAITSLALFVVAAPAQAKGKKGKKGGASSKVLSHLDKDHNGTIDGAEATKAQAIYAALYALDTNHDGQLSESELAAAKIQAGGKKGGKKKKTQ